MKRFEADLLATWAITMPLHSTLLQVCYALFCQGDLQGRGPCPRKARPRHGPRCCCCRPVPAWRGPRPRPRGTWVSIETDVSCVFFYL